LRRQYGLPWLADFRDPWVTNLPITHWTMRLRFLRGLEAKVMRDANVLIANTPLNQRGWADAYPASAGKIVTITNGFDPERFAAASPYALGEKVTILHAGELYHQRDPRPLLNALHQIRAADSAFPGVVVFLGRQTAGMFDFDQEIRSRDLGDVVRLVDQVPYAEALERMMRADILLLVNSPDFRVGVPAKLYEYLGAGRPILALAEPESDVAWVLRESGVLHRIAPPRDVSAIKQALLELTREVQAGASAVPNREALQQFTRERMAQKFAEALDRSVVPK
jgi:glycosyltransferase involved in cell wall biosynthesis